MVDDGSPDSRAAIAARVRRARPRFRLVQQPNGGLGNARNTGAEHATGDYLTFVDSDDVVVRNAYELLVGSLEETGSDFAIGQLPPADLDGHPPGRHGHLGVHRDPAAHARLEAPGPAQRPHRLEQGLPPLVLDRERVPLAGGRPLRGHPGDAAGPRPGPVGRRAAPADLPVAGPRGRQHVDHPAPHRAPRHPRPHQRGRRREPLHGRAGPARAEEEVRPGRRGAGPPLLPAAARRGRRHLPGAVPRPGQRLLRPGGARRLRPPAGDRPAQVAPGAPAAMPELLEVLRFEKSGEISATPVVRRGRRFWGDYPFRGGPRLGIPEKIYRLDRDELPLRARIEDVYWDGDDLRLAGFAHIAFLDLSREGSPASASPSRSRATRRASSRWTCGPCTAPTSRRRPRTA